MKIIWHSLVLLFSFGLIFAWEQGPLSLYTVQFLALMIVVYLTVHIVRRRMKKDPSILQQSSGQTNSGQEQPIYGGIIDVFALNTAIFLLIYATGQMASWFFFLLYFLGFGITFIFEPVSVFVFAVGTIAIFLPEVIKNGGSIGTYIQLGSFILMSPLPYFFGKEYQDREKEEETIVELEERSEEAGKTIAKDVEEVLKDEKKNLPEKDVEKLNEILEESEDLRSEASQGSK